MWYCRICKTFSWMMCTCPIEPVKTDWDDNHNYDYIYVFEYGHLDDDALIPFYNPQADAWEVWIHG